MWVCISFIFLRACSFQEHKHNLSVCEVFFIGSLNHERVLNLSIKIIHKLLHTLICLSLKPSTATKQNMWVNMLLNTHNLKHTHTHNLKHAHTHTHIHTQSVNRLRHFRALILIASCTSGCSFHTVLNTEVVKRWLSSSDNSCGGYSSCKRHSHAPPTLIMDSCSGGHCYGSHFQNLLLQCYICFHSFWNINIQQMSLHPYLTMFCLAGTETQM